ncbi:MAG TPA: helicase-related protein, partial [Anaeromyxobacteraceae bacterium]
GLKTRDALLRLVRSRPGESGIVYCLSRKSVEATAELLRDHGVRAAAYHAGMEPEERTRAQDAFQAGAVEVVCATVAFGMGIDKPDIRYVIHRDMPRSVEGYYQEIGRAGRDGAPSDCVLFYSWADVASWDRLAEGSEAEVAELQRRQAREMFHLAEDAVCRHQTLVRHFGERIDGCGASCDLCAGSDLVSEARPVRARGHDERSGPGAGRAGARPPPAEPMDTEGAELFERLRAARKQLAGERKLPAYCVFSDAVLRALVERRPRDEVELAAVKGVGRKKAEAYAEAFLPLLRRGRA